MTFNYPRENTIRTGISQQKMTNVAAVLIFLYDSEILWHFKQALGIYFDSTFESPLETQCFFVSEPNST